MTNLNSNTSKPSKPTAAIGLQRRSATLRTSASAPDFALLIQRIRDGSENSAQELYLQFARGVKFLSIRLLGPDRCVDDLCLDVFDTVIAAIRSNKRRKPECLPEFVRAVVQRKVTSEISRSQRKRPRSRELEEHSNPVCLKSDAIRLEELACTTRVLRSLRSRDREVLIRFYFHVQTAEDICRDMGLTMDQFRNIKNRAKKKLTSPMPEAGGVTSSPIAST